jgi:hypothetical protein
MPTADDFADVSYQVSLFTPGLQFRAAKTLAFLLGGYADVFDGEPVSMGGFDGIPREVPQVFLKSEDGRRRLQAGPDRIDVFREGDALKDREEFVGWAVDLGVKYLRHVKATVGRVAFVTRRIVPDDEPAKTLSRHFCQERWTDTALNRPQDFELHAHKVFRLGDLFDVNSWMRCKTGIKREKEREPATKPNVILAEQDFNSLGEQMDSREIRERDVRKFFELAAPETDTVLRLYFLPSGH